MNHAVFFKIKLGWQWLQIAPMHYFVNLPQQPKKKYLITFSSQGLAGEINITQNIFHK